MKVIERIIIGVATVVASLFKQQQHRYVINVCGVIDVGGLLVDVIEEMSYMWIGRRENELVFAEFGDRAVSCINCCCRVVE